MLSAIRHLLSAICRLDWLFVLTANALFVSSKTYHPYMWAGVVLAALPFVARWAAEGRPTRRTPLDLPMGLFFLSAILGLWPSYDLNLSWLMFFHILGGVALFYLLVNHVSSERFTWACAAGLVALGLAAAIYFITQYQAADYPDKFAIIGRIGDKISGFFPKLFTFYAHPNVVAGLLAIVLPLALALSLGPMLTRRSHQASWQAMSHQPSAIGHLPSAIGHQLWIAYRLSPFFFLAAALVIAYALLLTSSRGAWLALGATSLLWLATRSRRHLMALAAIALGTVAATIILATQQSINLSALVGTIPAGERALNRFDVYRQTLYLIRDYPFTGLGLATFMKHYSHYVLLTDPLIPHSHNLALEVWLDQGLLGFVSFLALVVGFYFFAWRSAAPLSAVRSGALWGVTVFLLHGLTDTPQYFGRTLPVVFILMGLAVWPSPPTPLSQGLGEGKGVRAQSPRWFNGVTLVATTLAALALLGLWSPGAILGRWQANLGAVAQARLELPQWPEQSSLKIRRQADLSPAERYYAQALAYNPQDAVANERWGEIELAQGDYHRAIQHLEAARRADRGSYAARYSLGYAYVGAGRLEEAAALLAGLDNIVGDLNSQNWQRGDEPAWVLNAYRTSLRLQPCQVAVYRDLPRWFQAVALSPETKRVYAEELSRLGGICREQSDWEAATAALQARISLDPGNADYHRDLADAYRDAGQAGQAIAAYKQVLKLRPWDVYSQQELSKLGQ